LKTIKTIENDIEKQRNEGFESEGFEGLNV
jgi:hypothetical protein